MQLARYALDDRFRVAWPALGRAVDLLSTSTVTLSDHATVDGYWESWRGRWHRYRNRSLRDRHIMIPGDPIKKGDRRQRIRDGAIRDLVARDLRGTRRSTLIGPVALSIHFRTARADPPDLPRLTKYALDVLGATRAPAGSGPALYVDDRQVTLLHVAWSTAERADDASTYVHARPLRDVIDDLRLADELDSRVEDRIRADGPFELDDPLELVPPDDRLPSDLRAMLARHDRRRFQEAHLQRASTHLRTLLASSPERIAGARPRQRRIELEPLLQPSWDELDHTVDATWAMLFSQPLTIPAPSLPTHRDRSETVGRRLTNEMSAYAGRWSVLAPLEAPLSATLVVVPPPQGKDLDNIAMTVLPALTQVLRPGAGGTTALTGYQVIQLSRRPDDPPNGYLRIILGSAAWVSDWNQATRSLDRYVDTDFDR